MSDTYHVTTLSNFFLKGGIDLNYKQVKQARVPETQHLDDKWQYKAKKVEFLSFLKGF